MAPSCRVAGENPRTGSASAGRVFRWPLFDSEGTWAAWLYDLLKPHLRFRLDDAFHYDLAGSISNRDGNAFLVYVHPDILRAIH